MKTPNRWTNERTNELKDMGQSIRPTSKVGRSKKGVKVYYHGNQNHLKEELQWTPEE